MKISSPIKYISASGIVAGLALPSVGTFYALGIQYPGDPFIRSLAIISWCLMGAAIVLFFIGTGIWVSALYRERRQRQEDWATHGESLHTTIEYLATITQRETETYKAMEAEEQAYRDMHPGKSGRHLENAERLLKQSEMIQAQQELANAKARFLRIAPRKERRKAVKEWS